MISKYWESLNETSVKLLAEKGYENFKQTVGSVYNDFGGPMDAMKTTLVLWEELERELPFELLTKLQEPEVGNPIKVFWKGNRVSLDLGFSLREYNLITKTIQDPINSIVEIGGGYGRLAYVFKKMMPKLDYTMVDVEPALSLAQRYLKDVLPWNNIKFLHPEELEDKCDLVIACDCLHEMKLAQVDEYFDWVNKNAKYFYFSCWKDTTIPIDVIRWTKNSYPVPDHWEKLVDHDHLREGFFEEMYKI